MARILYMNELSLPLSLSFSSLSHSMFSFLLLEPRLQLTRRTLVSRSQRLALREDSLATNVHSMGELQSPVSRRSKPRQMVVLAVGMIATHGVARVPPRLR